MQDSPSSVTVFKVYRTTQEGAGDVVTVTAATPYDAALSIGPGIGDVVVVSPNGIESRFGYRTQPPLVHLDD